MKENSKTSVTLQGTNISPQKWHFEDDFPFPKVGYVNFLEGIFFWRCMKTRGKFWCQISRCFISPLRPLSTRPKRVVGQPTSFYLTKHGIPGIEVCMYCLFHQKNNYTSEVSQFALEKWLGGGFKYFFIFTATWGNDPIWLIFFRWVETTNQKKMVGRWSFPFRMAQIFKGRAVKLPGISWQRFDNTLEVKDH